ncbi:MAG: YHS domain-containing protein [Chitinophagales bacterium]
MQKVVFLSLAVAFLSACTNPEALKTSTTPVPEQKMEVKLSALADNKDHVCGMELEQASLKDTATYEGKMYGFCNEGCKAEFVKDPKKYLAAQ